MESMKYLLSYTRTPIDNIIYDPRLAYSMHLALSDDGQSFSDLNHNSGVLFALATENEDGSLNAMSLFNPFIFKYEKGGFGVIAQRVLADGEEDPASKGKYLLWDTSDFLRYKELGLFADTELPPEAKTALEEWTDRPAAVRGFDEGEKEITELPEGAVPCSILEIEDAVADRLIKKLTTPYNVSVEVPDSLELAAGDETFSEKINACSAICNYSDGTSIRRSVSWDTSKVDFNKPGEYEISGTVNQKHFDFTVAEWRADPDVFIWEGKYYFISTNDKDGNKTIFVRQSDTIEGLSNARDHLILDTTMYPEIGGLLWAPEFHEINGNLYIFHAATTGEFFWEESNIMILKKGGSPINKEDWSRPRRIVKADGSDLCEAGKEITLDMTVWQWDGTWYACWSQRQFLPKDLGAWLYIAKINPDEPWRLASEPVVLSKPDYGWGNNHTFVEEGPFALPVNDRLYLTFSAAAVDTSYVVSYLAAEHGADLLNPKAWRKNNYPILTSRSSNGEYGTGHNAYVVDEDGFIWNTYHARPGTEGNRSAGIRRVHLDIDGEPMLDVTEEKDLNSACKSVRMVLKIK